MNTFAAHTVFFVLYRADSFVARYNVDLRHFRPLLRVRLQVKLGHNALQRIDLAQWRCEGKMPVINLLPIFKV